MDLPAATRERIMSGTAKAWLGLNGPASASTAPLASAVPAEPLAGTEGTPDVAFSTRLERAMRAQAARLGAHAPGWLMQPKAAQWHRFMPGCC
jgi:hypothetical protein